MNLRSATDATVDCVGQARQTCTAISTSLEPLPCSTFFPTNRYERMHAGSLHSCLKRAKIVHISCTRWHTLPLPLSSGPNVYYDGTSVDGFGPLLVAPRENACIHRFTASTCSLTQYAIYILQYVMVLGVKNSRLRLIFFHEFTAKSLFSARRASLNTTWYTLTF